MAEAICLVIDCGASASQKPPEGQSFLEAALECASLFVERKLFAETKDEIGIILCGTEETKNSLDYENVTVLERGLAKPDWDCISFLRNHVKGTEIESDWIDALVVALDFLKQEREGKKFVALKIVLFSDLGCRTDNDQMDVIIQGMKKIGDIDFTHIGPDWLNEDGLNGDQNGHSSENGNSGSQEPSTSRGEPEKQKLSKMPRKPKTKVQELNESIVAQIVHETDGTMCSLDDALAIFLYKNKRGKKPWPWKVVLELGPDIRINTTGFVKVRRENPKSWKTCLAREKPDEIEELRPETTLIRNNEDQEVMEEEATVFAYQYGNESVNISPEEEAAYKFDGGPKAMSVYGFLSRGEVEITGLVGNGCMVFLPTEGDENSATALSVLTQAMQEQGVVAIVRKVYSRAASPRLGILAPEEDANGELTLVYVDLPFIEDVRELQFANVLDEKVLPNDELVSAVDDLIDTMNLDVAGDEDGEGGWQLCPEEIMNPGYQYLFQSLTYRALYPNRALPEVPQHLKDSMEPPPENVDAAQPDIQRIRELFPLEVVLPKKAKRTGQAVFGDRDNENKDDKEGEPESKKLKTDDLSVDQAAETSRVGSITPVEDFRYLLSHSVTTGATIESAGQELEGVITRLIASAFGNDLNPKIVSCLQAYREECQSRGKPDLYNIFIRKIKDMAGKSLWSDILAANLGLLSKADVEGGVEVSEAEAFSAGAGGDGAAGAEAEDAGDEEEDMMDLL